MTVDYSTRVYAWEADY
jgi:hypothetical protein